MGKRDNANTLPLQWEEVYVEFGPMLYNYGRKITPNITLIEDSIHDVFVKLLKKPESLKSIKNTKAYLFQSFRRELLNKLKDSQRNSSFTIEKELALFDIELSKETIQIAEETFAEQEQKLKHALQQLSPRQKEAIYLKFYENYSYEEVAEIMKLDKAALYTMVYKSLSQLRKSLHASSSRPLSLKYNTLFKLCCCIFYL